jgi:hypothetical protein
MAVSVLGKSLTYKAERSIGSNNCNIEKMSRLTPNRITGKINKRRMIYADIITPACAGIRGDRGQENNPRSPIRITIEIQKPDLNLSRPGF